jgi:mannose-6-phosphate isomerase-like protein (cupin superfamily)
MDMLPVDYPRDAMSGDRIVLGTDEISVVTSSDDTNGDIYAVLLRMPPGGGPPLMHRHAPSEVYHVLDGELVFYVGRADGTVNRVTVRAGQVMPLAGGTPHTIRNESDAEAVAFGVHTPGRVMERFTRSAAAMAADGVPAMDRVLALAEEYGIEMLGPIPEHPR